MTSAEHARLALRRLAAELRAEMATLDRIASSVDVTASIEPPRFQDLLALAALLQHFYTCIESMLLRVLRHFEEREPTGSTWHRDLLFEATISTGARPVILSAPTLPGLQKLLGFRHFFRHAYSMDLDPRELRLRVENLREVHPLVRGDLDRLFGHLDLAGASASGDGA